MSETPKINSECRCPNNCVRHGNCDACRANHAKNGSKTHCQRNPQ